MTQYNGADDSKLIPDFKAGKRAAFDHVYHHYVYELLNFSKRYLRSLELAEEAVHDVFMKLWEQRHLLRDDLPMRPYLFTICRNHILNVIRKAAHETRLQEVIIDACLTHDEHPENEVIAEEYDELLSRAVERLPAQQRVVFKLRREENKTHEQIAATLRISRGTVNNHLIRAQKYIQEFIASEADYTFLSLFIILLLP